MSNDPKVIEQRIARLERAIDLLNLELAVAKDEYLALERPITLDSDFFWSVFADVMIDAKVGLTSSDVATSLRMAGFLVSESNVRTFLSRNKSKGNLVTFNKDKKVFWRLSPHAIEVVNNLAKKAVNKPNSSAKAP